MKYLFMGILTALFLAPLGAAQPGYAGSGIQGPTQSNYTPDGGKPAVPGPGGAERPSGMHPKAPGEVRR